MQKLVKQAGQRRGNFLAGRLVFRGHVAGRTENLLTPHPSLLGGGGGAGGLKGLGGGGGGGVVQKLRF
jgi:hypothetical protein